MIVYALVKEDGTIVNILPADVLRDSGEDVSRWVQIDEGAGQRYERAQQYYLPRGLWDATGTLNYKLVDGAVAERSIDEKIADGAEGS